MYNKIPIFYKMLHLYTSKSFLGQINHIKISIHERNIRKLYMFKVGCNQCSYCWCLLAVMFDSFATPWTLAYQALLPMGFSRQEYWNGLPFPSSGDLLIQGLNPHLLHFRWILYPLSHQGSPNLVLKKSTYAASRITKMKNHNKNW